ncbi:MAG: hypothetical protein Unbinned1473contig1000_13 [Prokaryotic dsDNA virus sp.]|nr:MAG: hypothetical protein Unbinned1473contig1000_13 [Prokaryotic dsDNA virus sp.]
MNDSKEKLHKLLVEQGLYTKSYDEFNEQFSLPEKQQKLYSLMQTKGLYTKSQDDFSSQFFADSPVVEEVVDLKKKGTTESLSEGGGLGESDIDRETLPPVSMDSTELALPSTPESESLSKDGTPIVKKNPDNWNSFYGEGINSEPQEVNKYLIPSLFPKDENNITDNPDDYERLSGDEAFDRAASMGLYEFKGNEKKTLFDERDLFEKSLSNIDNDLMSYEEEFIVPKLNNQLSSYGFTFEEDGALGDAIKVTADNDETEVFQADNFFDSNNSKEAEALKDFLRKNKSEKYSVFEDTQKAIDSKRVFLDEEEIKNTVRQFNTETKDFISERNTFVKQYEDFKKEADRFEGYSQTEIARDPKLKKEYDGFLSLQKNIQSQFSDISKMEEDIKSKGAVIDRAAGEFYDMQRSQGSWAGGIYNKLIKGAISNVPKTAMRLAQSFNYEMESSLQLTDEDKAKQLKMRAKAEGIEIPQDLDYEQTVKWLKDYDTKVEINTDWWMPIGLTRTTSFPTYESLSSADKNEFLVDILYGGKRFRNPFSETAAGVDTDMGLIDAVDEGARKLWMSDSTTEKWEEMKSEGFWGGAVLGLAESLPAMVGGSTGYGWAQRTAQMYSMTSEHVYEEMEESPEFDNITESEKAMVAVPIGIAVGALETIGLRNVIAQKGLLNGVLSRAFAKSTSETTAKTFAQFVRDDVKSMVAKGALTITGAGLAEFETGAAQEVADIGIKAVYNNVKEKEMFRTPDTLNEYVMQVLRAGAQEMVGGFILGAPSAVSVAMTKKDGLQELPTDIFEVIDLISKDESYKSMYVSKLKQRIASGDITKEEGDAELARVNKMLGVAPSLPSGLSSEQKKEAFILIEEKNTLESEIKKEDESLTKSKQERVSKIKERLEEMSLEVEDSQAATEYVAELKDTKEADPDTYWSVSAVTPEDAQNGTVIDVDGGKGLVTQDGDIIGVFKNIGSKVKGVADNIIQEAIKVGGVKLDNFDGYLTKIYERNGFRVTSRVPFNEEYAPEGWSEEKNGRPDVVSMVYDPNNELDIEVKTFDNPEEANAYRNSFISKEKAESQETEMLGTEEELESLTSVLEESEDLEASDDVVDKLNVDADFVLSSLSKIIPNTKIVVHKYSRDYKEATGKTGKGYYKNGVIHINASKSDGTTLAHEAFHALFLYRIKNKKEASRAALNLMRSVRKSIGKNSKLAKAIDEFASNYDESVQNEERLAELIGIMSDEYINLTKPVRIKIAEFFRSIAKKLGINLGDNWGSNDQEVIDMMNNISKGFRSGEEIDSSVVDIIEKSKVVSSKTLEEVENSGDVVGDVFEIPSVKNEGNEIQLNREQKELVNRGGIDMSSIKKESINKLSGVKAFVFAADKATFGMIKSPSGAMYNFKGGYLYPYGTGFAWAFTTEDAAKRVLKKVNESDGVGLVMAQGEEGITGSLSFYEYMMAEVDNAIAKGANPKELLQYINKKLRLTTVAKALAKKGLPAQITSIEELRFLMPIEGKSKFSYPDRSSFTKNFFSSESLEKFGIPPLTKTSKSDIGVLDYVNDPSLKGVEYGDVVSAIQFDKNSPIIDTRGKGLDNEHPSYPFVVEGKPLMVFEKAIDVRLVMPNAKPTTEGANQTPLKDRAKSRAAKSAMGGQFVQELTEVRDPLEREQKSVDEVISEGRENDFRDEVIRDYLVRVMGIKASDADAALKTDISSIPESFKNISGGLKAGLALYKKVNDKKNKLLRRNERSTRMSITELNAKIKEFAREKRKEYDTVEQINEKVAKQRTKIENNNKRRKKKLNEKEINIKVSEFRNKLYDARDAKRAEVNEEITKFEKSETKKNNRRVPILTQQQIMDELILFLQKQPEYIEEGDKYKVKGEVKYRVSQSTTQAKMISDLQKKEDISPTQNMSEKVRQARMAIRNRMKGKRDAEKIKNVLRNFMRRSLPPILYSKSEVMNMLKKIEIADSRNLENLMNEVAEFVITKNVDALQKSIGDVLNGDYTKTQNGIKKAKKISLAIKERIEKIKTSIAKDDMTAEQILEANSEMNKEYNELSKKAKLTVEDVNRMVDLQVIMEINSSMLMDNNESAKVDSLELVNGVLQELIRTGRTQLSEQIAEKKDIQAKQFEMVYEDVTGEKIDLNEEGATERLDEAKIERGTKEQREKVNERIKTFFKQIFMGIDSIFTSAEALDGLMDKISSLPAEMFGGKTQEVITRKVDEASRVFKQRTMYVESLLNDKMKEIYGKGWRKKAIENSRKKHIVYRNKAEVDQAIAFHKASPNQDTKKAMDEAIKKNEIYLTQNQMYYLYNQYKDPANADSFKAKYGNDYKTVMEQIDSGLNKEVKQFADWQVDVLFPSLYEYYNEAYKSVFRTNMPWNMNYAGRIYRDNVDVESINLLANNTVYNTAVGAASTKSRVDSKLPIKDMDGSDALMTYLYDMEYFAAYNETINDINRLFNNQYIKDAIIKIHGKVTWKLIDNSIKTIANRGNKDSLLNSMVNSMNNVFIMSRLAFSPVVMIKQLTSAFTYYNDIGLQNWLKYSAKNMSELRSVYKEVRDNSVYMRDRGNESIMKAIESYSSESMRSFVPSPTKKFIVDALMWTTKFGDKTAIYMGGLANYSYYKDQALKAGKSEEQAIKEAVVKFERDTKRTQQSADLQDKDFFQTSNPLFRAANMFLTTPKQYLRKEIQAVRSLSRKIKAWDKNAGKGTIGENVRTLITYHVIMPVLFQYVAAGFPALARPLRDDDDDDILRAGIIGNLNALFILGEIFAGLGDFFTDKPWAGENAKSVAILQVASSLLKKAKRAEAAKSDEKKAELWKKFYLELATLSGAPAPTINKFIDNYSRLNEGDLGEAILRILNYSDYQIKGAKPKKTDTKTIYELNEEYHKQLKREERAKKKKEKEMEMSFRNDGFVDDGFGDDGFGDDGF